VRAAAGIALGLAVAVGVGLGACGGSTKAEPDWQVRLRKENEITLLWNSIRDWRREAHMAVELPRGVELQWLNRPIAEAKLVCPDAHETPATCGDVCVLATDICDNAEAICRIADDLGKGDDYAQDKCASAKASCREAKQRCCTCSKSPGATAP
jgi:hypothetical protein